MQYPLLPVSNVTCFGCKSDLGYSKQLKFWYLKEKISHNDTVTIKWLHTIQRRYVATVM